MESNFRQKQQEELEAATSSQSASEVEFANPEGAIRHDRADNPPPKEIAERLNQSIAAEPKQSASIWSKFGFKK